MIRHRKKKLLDRVRDAIERPAIPNTWQPYVVRSASVGERFDALIADCSPAMPPMSNAAANPPIIATGGTSVAQPLMVA